MHQHCVAAAACGHGRASFRSFTLLLNVHFAACRYLKELGQDAELINLDLKERQHKTEEFVKVQGSKQQKQKSSQNVVTQGYRQYVWMMVPPCTFPAAVTGLSLSLAPPLCEGGD